jgi:homeobox protein ESX1
MITPELRTYLDHLRDLPSAPKSEDLRTALIAVGWNDELINEAIDYFYAPEVIEVKEVLPLVKEQEYPKDLPTETSDAIVDITNTVNSVEPVGILPESVSKMEPSPVETIGTSPTQNNDAVFPSTAPKQDDPQGTKSDALTESVSQSAGEIHSVPVRIEQKAPPTLAGTSVVLDNSVASDSVKEEGSKTAGDVSQASWPTVVVQPPDQSQSILYPDNSSRLGLRGVAMRVNNPHLSEPVVSPSEPEPVPPEPPVPPIPPVPSVVVEPIREAIDPPVQPVESVAVVKEPEVPLPPEQVDASSEIQAEVFASPLPVPEAVNPEPVVDVPVPIPEASTLETPLVPTVEESPFPLYQETVVEPLPTVSTVPEQPLQESVVSEVLPEIPTEPPPAPTIDEQVPMTPPPVFRQEPERVEIPLVWKQDDVQVNDRQEPVPERVIVSSVKASPRVSSHRLPFPLMLGLGAIALGIIAGVAYVYMAKIGPFAQTGPYRESSFAVDMLAGFKKIKTANNTFSVSARVTPREKGVLAYDGSPLTSATSSFSVFDPTSKNFLSLIPPDALAQFTFSGKTNRSASTTAFDTAVGLSGSVSFASSTMSGAIEFVRSGGVSFIKIDSLPTLLTSLIPKIEDTLHTWYELDDIDAISLPFLSPVSSSLAGQERRQPELTNALFVSLAEAIDTEQVFSFKNGVSRVPVGNTTLYRYEVGINGERLPPLFRRVSNILRTTGDDAFIGIATMIGKMAMYTEQASLIPLLSYLSDTVTITVDVNEQGIPLAISSKVRLIPGKNVTSLSSKQIVIDTAVAFSSINLPITVVAPTSTRPFTDLARSLSGLSGIEYSYVLQNEHIDLIRRALRDYQDVVGQYPISLAELTKTAKEVSTRRNESANAPYRIYENRPFLAKIPLDVYTGAPYVYTPSASGTDYRLAYRISLPVWSSSKRGVKIQTVFVESVATYALTLLDGVNTATSLEASLEARGVSKIDTDRDGLTDSLEKYVGTDPKRNDSNRDGKNDRDEFRDALITKAVTNDTL